MTTRSTKNVEYKQRYVHPTVPKSGYEYVTAGSLKRNFGGYGIYVKYKAGPTQKIILKERTMNHVWFICPDRELVIVRNNLSPDAFVPYGDSFDKFVDVSLFNDDFSKSMGINYHMTNYVHNPHAVNRRTDLRTHPDSRIQVLSDSGGLQLVARKDKSLIINPRELVEFYNNNVDAGMVLDIPLAIADEKTTMRAAHLQKMNSDIMLKHATGPDLINIFHGHNDYERAKYRDIVENDRITRLALGGVVFNSMLSAVSIIYSALETQVHYKQYHILGVFLATYLPLLVKIANEGDHPPHITSDSTSHIQSAANRAYHFQFDITSTSKRLPIGTRSAIPNTSRILPCQCIVCSTLKYTDILGFGESRHTTELLALHNAYEMSRYTQQLQEACTTLSRREYNSFVCAQLHKNPQLKEFKSCLDFIQEAADSGTKHARNKYNMHLNLRRESKTAVPQGKPLFGEYTESELIERQAHVLRLMTKMETLGKSLQ